jgi:hypothetical protein
MLQIEVRVYNEEAGHLPKATVLFKGEEYDLSKASETHTLTKLLFEDKIHASNRHYGGLFSYGAENFFKLHTGCSKPIEVVVNFGNNAINAETVLSGLVPNPVQEINRRIELVNKAFEKKYPKTNLVFSSEEVREFVYDGYVLSVSFAYEEKTTNSHFLNDTVSAISLSKEGEVFYSWSKNSAKHFEIDKLRTLIGAKIAKIFVDDNMNSGVFGYGRQYCLTYNNLDRVGFEVNLREKLFLFSNLRKATFADMSEILRSRLDAIKIARNKALQKSICSINYRTNEVDSIEAEWDSNEKRLSSLIINERVIPIEGGKPSSLHLIDALVSKHLKYSFNCISFVGNSVVLAPSTRAITYTVDISSLYLDSNRLITSSNLSCMLDKWLQVGAFIRDSLEIISDNYKTPVRTMVHATVVTKQIDIEGTTKLIHFHFTKNTGALLKIVCGTQKFYSLILESLSFQKLLLPGVRFTHNSLFLSKAVVEVATQTDTELDFDFSMKLQINRSNIDSFWAELENRIDRVNSVVR